MLVFLQNTLADMHVFARLAPARVLVRVPVPVQVRVLAGYAVLISTHIFVYYVQIVYNVNKACLFGYLDYTYDYIIQFFPFH